MSAAATCSLTLCLMCWTAWSGGDGHVYMPEDGVLLSVSAVSGEQAAKDAVLATYCPKDCDASRLLGG